MSTATYSPSLEEWWVLNLLWRKAMAPSSRNASAVMNATNARPSDLGCLAELGFIGAERGGKAIDVRADDQWWTHSLRETTLRLGTKGLNWVSSYKPNVALYVIGEHGLRAGCPLIKVTSEVGIEPLPKLTERRLAVIHGPAGDPIDASTLGATVMRDLKTYSIVLTDRGRRLVAS